MIETTEIPKRSRVRSGLSVFALFVIIATIILGTYIRLQFNQPADFQAGASFEVTSGMSVKDIAAAAKTQHVVRSELLLYSILTYSYDPTNIYAGTYIFDEPTSVFGVAQKLADKDIENRLLTVTVPEGITAVTIANIAVEILPEFSATTYIALTKNKEGYLFPETYFVPESYTAENLLALQLKTYEENMASLRPAIEQNPLTEYEVLILASIVEREANNQESMKMVSGILQNRLGINMPLQADASVEYVLNKPLSELTAEDLKVDSPYNTYTHTGLVPTPIGNPGIMAIEAVVHPTPSDNLFYITAPDGTFHYAKTFSEHNQNIARYLR